MKSRVLNAKATRAIKKVARELRKGAEEGSIIDYGDRTSSRSLYSRSQFLLQFLYCFKSLLRNQEFFKRNFKVFEEDIIFNGEYGPNFEADVKALADEFIAL